jgi:hypothetical protein
MSVISVSIKPAADKPAPGLGEGVVFQKEPLSEEGKSYLIISNRMPESSMA